MNDPMATPIDIEEQRAWLRDFHRQLGSWKDVAKRVGVASGTISQFGSDKGYAGDEQKLAESVFRYRQYLAAQSAVQVEMPSEPGYFETETSLQITNMLAFGQRGEIVAAATGAGLGKTRTARHYAACFPNVFYAAMAPSTAGVNNMQIELLEKLGEKNAVGTPQKLSRRIKEKVANLSDPLIIIDEAQHLSEKALEEIRGWNDDVGVGIALLGNIRVLQRLEGGGRQDAFAQLFSRVSLRMVRPLPLSADVEALADAWGIHADPVRAYLHKICMTPGGLRNGSKALKIATMLAAAQRQMLDAGHLQDAWAQLSSRSVLS